MPTEKTQTPQLPIQSSIFLITGHSGTYEDKSSWIVCAYSELGYAQKAQKFLEKLANRLDKHADSPYTPEFARDLEELKLHDPKAGYMDYINYFVEEVKVVV